MSKHPLTHVYGYGFLVKEKELSNNHELFVEEFNNWVKSNTESFRSDTFFEISEEAKSENRSVEVSDFVEYLSGYPEEEFQPTINKYIAKNFPLLRAIPSILDKKKSEDTWFICISRTHIYPNFQKIEKEDKPTSEEKTQLKAFRKFLGVETKPDWLHGSYIDYPLA